MDSEVQENKIIEISPRVYIEGHYIGKFYGKASFILYKDGIEILHTGFRNNGPSAESFHEFIKMFEMLVEENSKRMKNGKRKSESSGSLQ